MVDKFQYGGRKDRETKAYMMGVSKHKTVMYLIAEVSTKEDTRKLVLITQGLMKQGGLGIALDTVGVAYAPKTWLELDIDSPQSTIEYLTTHVYTETDLSTYGMKVFGQPDVKYECTTEELASTSLKALAFQWGC